MVANNDLPSIFRSAKKTVEPGQAPCLQRKPVHKEVYVLRWLNDKAASKPTRSFICLFVNIWLKPCK